jgi:inorganic pyrophosphatase
MTNLTKLTPFDEDDVLQVVVESPRGSAVKYEYSATKHVFTVARSLPLGQAYPFDWGFVPGTRAADGDPVDAMVIHPGGTFPGIVLPCRLLGMIELEQRDGRGKRQVNNRLIATPSWHEALKGLDDARDLPKMIKTELEHFFVAIAKFTSKHVRVTGWKSANNARRFVNTQIV